MRLTPGTFVMLVSLWLTVACASRQQPEQEGDVDPQTVRTTVRVQNQAFNDMTIYVLRGAERVRLGIATGNATTTLEIPRNIITGVTGLRFLADPIGGTRTPVSEEITVSPGDQVTLTIPPS
jgi:hypothetical protein